MPARSARAKPAASGWLLITQTIFASRRPASIASISDCRFEPRPEMMTTIGSGAREDLLDADAGRSVMLLDVSDVIDGLTARAKRIGDRVGLVR